MNYFFKRIGFWITVLCFSVVFVHSTKAEIVDSGSYEETNWILDDEGVLTFSGTGKTGNFVGKFYENKDKVKKVIVQDGILEINEQSFCSFSNLESVDIADSVTIIGQGAFSECPKLVDVNLPDNLTEISTSLFYNCTSLETVNIPEGVTKIGLCAFLKCENLKSVNIPNSVKEIEGQAFGECVNLSCPINIPEGVTKISYSAFQFCEKIPSVSIPSTVTEIEVNAFYSCKNLKELNIPDSVKSIGYGTFAFNENVSKIIMPTKLEELDKTAFSNIYSLETIVFTNGFDTYDLNDSKFPTIYESSKLKNIIIADNVNIQNLSGLYEYSKVSGEINLYISPQEVNEHIEERLPQDFSLLTYCEYNNGNITEHSFDEGNVVKESDCGQHGEIKYTCETCDYAITEELPLSSEHTYGEGIVTKEPNCAENGIICYICQVCGETKEESIEKTSVHKYDSGIITKEANCLEEGKKVYKCLNCGNQKEESITKTGVHKYDNGIFVKEPSCLAAGEKVYTCQICGMKMSERIDPVSHISNEGVITKNASYKENGTITYSCIYCGEILDIKSIEKLCLKAPIISSAKCNKKSQVSLKWKRVEDASGYEIQIALKNNFKNKRSITIKKGKTLSTTIKSLKKGKKYFIRVRAYIKSSRKKIYSTWSKTKTIKIK